MALIETTGLESLGPHTITGAHRSGDIAPTFTVSLFPERGNEDVFDIHRDWTPPAEIAVTIAGATWTCVPGDTPRRVSGDEGVSYSVQYIPSLLYILRHGKYKKNVAWVSAPQWQIDQYISSYNTDDWEVFEHESDVYASTGFTVGDLLEKLGDLIGKTIVSLLPDFHPAQRTITLRKDQVLLGWIQSLLPSGFVYTWDWKDDELTVSLAERAHEPITLPPYALVVDIDEPAIVTYDRVVISGAPYKINSGMTLGDSRFTKKSSGDRFLKLVEEALPPVTSQLDGRDVTTTTTRLLKLGPDGTPFAIREEEDVVVGPVYDKDGEYSHQDTIQTRTRTYAYDNDDSIIYLQPRLTSVVEVFSGYTTVLSTSQIASSDGRLYYLTEDLEILNRTQFLAAESPSILLSAYTGWVASYQTITEEMTYITPTDVTPDWPEGFEQQHTRKLLVTCYKVNGVYYPCTGSPQDLLAQIAQALQEVASISTFATVSKYLESENRRVALTTPGAYMYHTDKLVYDQAAGKLTTIPTSTPVQSTPPSSPSQFRVEPLEASVGDPGTDVIFATSVYLPTANPQDLELWAGKLYYDMTHRQRGYRIAVHGYSVPQGYRIGGGTVIGWSASREGNQERSELSII